MKLYNVHINSTNSGHRDETTSYKNKDPMKFMWLRLAPQHVHLMLLTVLRKTLTTE